MSHTHNTLPEDAKIITDYEEQQRFFIHSMEQESRQPQYNPNNFMEGFFNLRIFWVRKELGIGYGFADNWKEKRVDFYRFGSEENWTRFNRGFASQFTRDNS